jgi:phosphate transport system permease protein
MGIHRGHRARPLEWLAEKFIFSVSLSAIAMVFLIFLFVGREALPLFLGQMNSALVQEVIPSTDLEKISPVRLAKYLGMTPSEVKSKDPETLRTMMEIREEAAKEVPEALKEDKDSKIDTTEWRYLLRPHQWTGYAKPELIWQPVGTIPKYNLWPLLIGSLKTTLIGLTFAVPLALAAALYVSQLARPSWKEWIKPGVEFLSGIPSIVLGAFAFLVLAGLLQDLFGYRYRLNAFVAGIALGLTAVPLIFSIAEDALTSVPRSYVQAALALGASKWQTTWQIVLPAAAPGVFAAVVLGFGRCIGETMVVLLASGNASVVSWNIFDSTRSLTATIAAEMAEAVNGGHHYRVLFMLGTLLFAVTFVTNLVGDLVMMRLKRRREGK